MFSYDNTGKHIDDIINKTPCAEHRAHVGAACFYVFLSTKNGSPSEAICNDRIKSAGFNGQIQPSSLRQKNRDGNRISRL